MRRGIDANWRPKQRVRSLFPPRTAPRKRRRRRPEVEAHAGAMLQLLSMLPLSNENGLARTPPLGWRSWNLYGANVNQSLIEGIMDGMTRKGLC